MKTKNPVIPGFNPDPSVIREEAGLTAYMNFEHHYDVFITQGDGTRRVVPRKIVEDMTQTVTSASLRDGPVSLRIGCDGALYIFAYAQDGEETILGTGVAKFLSPEVAATARYSAWTGVYIGMFASGNGKPCVNPADFAWFEYRVEGE